jgi:hypothetical protein
LNETYIRSISTYHILLQYVVLVELYMKKKKGKKQRQENWRIFILLARMFVW